MPSQADFAPYASLAQNKKLNGHGATTHYPFGDLKSTLKATEYADIDLKHDEIPEVDAVIIGASWAGIWALHRLQSLGLNVKLLDACSDVGGTWWYTRYPGCRVDTEIPFYEFSKPELWQKWSWSERFPSRSEIQRYLSWVCDELDIRKNIIFQTRVTAALWDETAAKWMVSTNTDLIVKTQFILPCTGYSTIRNIPSFPGLQSFAEKYHSSEWPEDLDCSGKRVAVIGTAASGIQIVEALSKEVAQLTVFQRTPNLATPMRNVQYSEAEMEKVKKEYPQRFAGRNSRNGFDKRTARPSMDDTPEEREAFFESLWERGGLAFWFANYTDMLSDPVANIRAYNFWRTKVRQRIHDRDIAEKLAPIKPPHAFGTKRPSLETEYFEVFNQPNVELVDVNSDPIIKIVPEGILTASGRLHSVDVMALATGFDYITGSMLAMGIEGKEGLRLNGRWRIDAGSDGIFTHLGLMTRSFPNMFFPMGPQAPSALGLTPQMAEIQGDWIANLLLWMRRHGKTTVEPSTEAEAAWTKETVRAADDSLFSKTDSWYMGVNIPGRKRQPLCYFGGVDKYIAKLNESAENNYRDLLFE